MRFDWYQCTIEEKNPHVVISALEGLGHEVRDSPNKAKAWRYTQGWDILHKESGVVATVLHGGNGENVHALATSDPAEAFSDVVRACWPTRHLVTRCDAAEDFNDPTAYRRLCRVGKRIAKAKGLAFTSIEDRLDRYAGRTQYIGSPKSDYRCRIYEKGYEQARKLAYLWEKQGVDVYSSGAPSVLNTDTGEYIPAENWVRTELQVRARQEEGRRRLAQLTAEQCWSVSPWAVEFAREALTLDLEREVIRTRKMNSDLKSFYWMCGQYGDLMIRLAQEEPRGWHGLAMRIRNAVLDQRRIK